MTEMPVGRRAFVPRVRDCLSADLVNARDEHAVRRVIGAAVSRLTDRGGAWVLRPCLDGSHLHLHGVVGEPQKLGEVELSLMDHKEPWSRAMAGDPASGRAGALSGVEDHVLWVPMGAEHDRWVLAVAMSADRDSHHLRADLRAIADEAWTALQRAELIADLEGQLEIMSAITAVAGIAVTELRQAGERIARIAVTSLGASVSILHLVSPEGAIRPLSWWGADLSHGAGLDVAARLLAPGEEIVVLDGVTGPLIGPWSGGPVAEVVGLPLRIARRVVGLLVVARRPEDRSWDPLTLQVAAALAQQAALAIDHAQLLEREQETVRRLEDLDAMKADWLAGLTHDLKAPLTGLVGFTRTMLRHGDRISEEDRLQYLEAMDRQASRLVAMVDDLLLAARMGDADSSPLIGEVFGLGGVLEEAVEAFGPVTRRRFELTIEADPIVAGDRSQLLRVVTNLLDNACKYSGPVEPVLAVLRINGDTIEITVDDHGPGIPAEERDVVFERFGRGAEGQALRSTGLGLYIGRGIARDHGGDLVVEEAPTGGARLTLRLPLAPVSADPAEVGS